MSIIDQNSAWTSLGTALSADRALIDSRTEQDRLCFLSEFASLINFYDHENTVYGNWTPFLLKDPVFLVASISKTRYAGFYSLYQQTCQSLEQVQAAPALSATDLFIPVNQLLNQLTRVFMRLERWTCYMQLSNETYPLKEDVIKQIRTTFSGYFWAITSLRQYLFLAGDSNGIDPVEFYLFDAYDESIWKQGKDASPFWEVLGLDHPLSLGSAADILNICTALKRVGDELFHFFQSTIRQSAVEFPRLKARKSRYPDTILLRTFVSLLQVHQDQLNTIAHKHLHFYYKDILKQSPREALPDSVFLCASLAGSDATFYLNAGTVFSGGLDAQKNPIWFATRESVNLNPAIITGAHTLAVLPVPVQTTPTAAPAPVQPAPAQLAPTRTPAPAQSTPVKSAPTPASAQPAPASAQPTPAPPLNALHYQDVPSPGVIQKDQDGKAQSWQTFGGTPNAGAAPVQLGIAFASPMLLLREGTREITITLGYTGDLQLPMFQSASYYLSTATDWWTMQPTITGGVPGSPLVLFKILKPTDPSIESFVKNPDGLDSPWPMLKIVFHSFSDLSSPPVLNSLGISVNVSGVNTFQLYNDYGAVSAKAPFQLWGPTPLINSHFIIGNNEVFSKPLDSLELAITWNNLPPDFSDYYKAYNDYLSKRLVIPPSVSWIYKIFHPFKKKPAVTPVPEEEAVQLFNNTCFTVRFDTLQDQTWTDLVMLKKDAVQPQPQDVPLFTVGAVPVTPSSGPISASAPVPVSASTQGPATVPSPASISTPATAAVPAPKLLPASDFISSSAIKTQFSGDPWIQTTPLKYTGSNTSGFMRMNLTGPTNGFGSGFYPSVVYDVVMYNSKNSDNLEAPPAPPFAPRVVSLMGNYSASKNYTFDVGNSPLQCFLYTPFENYNVFDNTAVTAYSYTMEKLPKKMQSGVPLYPALNYEGFLFLEVQNLVAPNTLQLYVELSRTYIGSAPGNGVDYYYLSNSGWKVLPVLLDGTSDFCCSGIIKVNVPADINNQVGGGAGGVSQCLLAIAVRKNPASFAQTVYITTNGFVAQRTGVRLASGIGTPAAPNLAAPSPVLPAGSITKPQTVIPQIATILQPFPSFGGKAAEDDAGMHLRVSNRLKTKDRAVSAEDYFRLIREEYADIYYARPSFDPVTRETQVYVAKGYNSSMDPNAFIPLVSECKEKQVAQFLSARASGLAQIKVSNFDFQYVLITAIVDIQAGFEIQGMQKTLNDALNLYLSPWIVTPRSQTVIDQPISDAQVALFIKGLAGVAQVESILFQTWMADKQVDSPSAYQKTLMPLTSSSLFISYMHHQIQCNTAT